MAGGTLAHNPRAIHSSSMRPPFESYPLFYGTTGSLVPRTWKIFRAEEAQWFALTESALDQFYSSKLKI